MVTVDSYVWDEYLKAKDLKSEKLSDVNITQVQDSSDDTTVEDDSPLVNNEIKKTKKKKKCKLPETTSTAEDSKKGKMSTGEGMIDTLKSIASAVDGMKIEDRRLKRNQMPLKRLTLFLVY
ncbi:hypothetical protein GIB67_002881 [Kingdonia uniflora]|uniref:Uncharacterized protein n=1 Tax=Kingdonia uniflora TaxID=39325 RepID=A0A7J7NR13_9MAGN|nr:hypothetical protein GIB67_002881 [Kingdonia uniflora]